MNCRLKGQMIIVHPEKPERWHDPNGFLTWPTEWKQHVKRHFESQKERQHKEEKNDVNCALPWIQKSMNEVDSVTGIATDMIVMIIAKNHWMNRACICQQMELKSKHESCNDRVNCKIFQVKSKDYLSD